MPQLGCPVPVKVRTNEQTYRETWRKISWPKPPGASKVLPCARPKSGLIHKYIVKHIVIQPCASKSGLYEHIVKHIWATIGVRKVDKPTINDARGDFGPQGKVCAE